MSGRLRIWGILAALLGGGLLASCESDSGQGRARLTFFERSVSFLPDDSGLGGRTLEIGDVTGDGQAEIVVGHSQGVAVWSRLGSSLFRPQLNVPLPPAPAGAVELRLVDLDGDADLDFALITGRSELALWIQRASGSFSDETVRRLLGTSSPGALRALKVEDLDGDGAPDLFWSGARGTELLLNRSDGLFREPAGLVLPFELANQVDTSDAVFADLDGDGLLDLAVDLRGQIELVRGRPDGLFRIEPSAVPRLRSGRPRRMALADVDGDGDADLIASGAATASSNGGHVLLIHEGQGRFRDESLTLLPRSPASTHEVLAADLDLDGAVDLLFAAEGAVGAELFLNDGTGRFEDETRLLPALGPISRLRVYDIDGDRDLDILAPRPGARTALLVNQLDPGPEPTATPTAPPEPTPSPTP